MFSSRTNLVVVVVGGLLVGLLEAALHRKVDVAFLNGLRITSTAPRRAAARTWFSLAQAEQASMMMGSDGLDA